MVGEEKGKSTRTEETHKTQNIQQGLFLYSPKIY